MTQASDFYAERAFLGFVKNTIDNSFNSHDKIENAAVSILACASALEGATNRLLELKGILTQHERTSLRSKIELIAIDGNMPVDWNTNPWATIKNLLELRNWLAHYKVSWAGLTNRDGKWLTHCDPNAPKFSPHKDLNQESIAKHFQCVCNLIVELATSNNFQYEFDYILEEDFESMIQTG